jgi:hypothetical protein
VRKTEETKRSRGNGCGCRSTKAAAVEVRAVERPVVFFMATAPLGIDLFGIKRDVDARDYPRA